MNGLPRIIPSDQDPSFQRLKFQTLKTLKREGKEKRSRVKGSREGEGDEWLNTNLVVCGVLIRRLIEMNLKPVLM
jgi:hypothetical protein